jgi:hypothetical protein
MHFFQNKLRFELFEMSLLKFKGGFTRVLVIFCQVFSDFKLYFKRFNKYEPILSVLVNVEARLFLFPEISRRLRKFFGPKLRQNWKKFLKLNF